jgi:hypothetical protein
MSWMSVGLVARLGATTPAREATTEGRLRPSEAPHPRRILASMHVDRSKSEPSVGIQSRLAALLDSSP